MSITKKLSLAGCMLLAASPIGAWAAAKLPEGTDVRLQITEKISSATATEGQRFNLILDEDILVGGQVLVGRGAKAVGTVVSAHKRGYMGKAGELNVQINYLVVGEQRIPLRASSGREGDSKVGATVALTVLFGPIGLLKRGKDVEINPGLVLTAQVEQTTDLVVGWPPQATMTASSPAVASPAQPPVSQSATAIAYADPSGLSARDEFIKMGCPDSFSLISSSDGHSIFESTCNSGKRQLLDCSGGGCKTLN